MGNWVLKNGFYWNYNNIDGTIQVSVNPSLNTMSITLKNYETWLEVMKDYTNPSIVLGLKVFRTKEIKSIKILSDELNSKIIGVILKIENGVEINIQLLTKG